ncbi:PGF-CTERM sorting domain-containing protein [Methanocella sp. MCL-LM]|uniref:PGF-CTERM sorting domain-containing protein n=1 Tax=Methanocella sp. MCL-LM TaxID=3412035 RepID=UPI003C729FD0
MKTTTAAVIALSILAILSLTMDAAAIMPYYNTSYASAPAMNGTHSNTGAVSGRVATSDAGEGLANTYVAIVNASNTTQAFYSGSSDGQGFFQFQNVNNTYQWDPVEGGRYLSSYKLYINHSLLGEGFSSSFPVEEWSTSPVNVYLVPRPAKIVVTAERNHVEANGSDSVRVTANATDALGDPVPDGTLINFSIDSSSYSALANGSLSPDGFYRAGQGQYLSGIQTSGGRANVSFGWVGEDYIGNSSIIWAAYAGDSLINGSTGIYFTPALASWFGSVQDRFGKPYGGSTVTLHMVNVSGSGEAIELYRMTTTSYTGLPYPGSYVFDNIELNSSITYAYASAEADVGDGVRYYGKSDNYSLNKSRTSSGFIVLHVPMPDAIEVTADPDTILVGGDQSIITAQLFLNGKPYKRSGITITFFGSNDTMAYLPSTKSNVSDETGRTSILLTSNQFKGNVTVTGYVQSGISRNLTDSTVVHVVGWGTISGVVTDKNKGGIPGATVKLWTVRWANGTYENVALVDSPENPQKTVSRPEIAAIGTYTFYRVPAGIYNVTAEKAGISGDVYTWFAWVNLTAGTATANVALPWIWHGSIVTLAPTPVVQATPAQTASVPVPVTDAATPTPAPGFDAILALAGIISISYLAINSRR